MAHQDQRALVVAEHLLEEVEGLQVEVVGRLVEDQEVRRLGECAGDQQPVALAARQDRDGGPGLFRAEQEVLKVADHVTALPVHDHAVAAATGQHVGDGHAGFQHGPSLVEHHRHQVCAQHDLPRIGRQPPHQQIDERTLAGAVGPDDPQPVPTHHPQGQAVDDRPRTVGFRDVAGLDHQGARGFRVGRLHADAAYRAADLAAVFPELVQIPEAADVALAPGGDAVAQPVLLGDDLAVQLVLVALLLLKERVAPCFEAGEALLDPPGLAPVEPDRAARQGGQEPPVVADQHHCGAGALQLRFKPLDRRKVEVVGGLVEQQHIRFGGERLRQGGAPALAARQSLRILRAGEAQSLQQVAGAVGGFALGQSGLDEIEGRVEAGEVGFLREVADRGARLDEPAAPVGLDQTRGDLHQRRFAGAIPADQAGPLARGDGEFGAGDQRGAAESQRDVLKGEKRGSGHAPAYGSAGRAVQTVPPPPHPPTHQPPSPSPRGPRPVRRSDWRALWVS